MNAIVEAAQLRSVARGLTGRPEAAELVDDAANGHVAAETEVWADTLTRWRPSNGQSEPRGYAVDDGGRFVFGAGPRFLDGLRAFEPRDRLAK